MGPSWFCRTTILTRIYGFWLGSLFSNTQKCFVVFHLEKNFEFGSHFTNYFARQQHCFLWISRTDIFEYRARVGCWKQHTSPRAPEAVDICTCNVKLRKKIIKIFTNVNSIPVLPSLPISSFSVVVLCFFPPSCRGSRTRQLLPSKLRTKLFFDQFLSCRAC